MREDRLRAIKKMSDKDYDRFLEYAEVICDLCSPTETMCENCELCSLMSDLVYEFEQREKGKEVV